MLALVLADEGVGDVESALVGDLRLAEELGERGGEAFTVALEAEDVVGAAEAEAGEMAGDAGLVVVQQRGDADDLGEILRHQFREMRAPADGRVLAAEFQVAEQQVAEDGILIEHLFIESPVHR